jgi:hypothetical protein
MFILNMLSQTFNLNKTSLNLYFLMGLQIGLHIGIANIGDVMAQAAWGGADERGPVLSPLIKTMTQGHQGNGLSGNICALNLFCLFIINHCTMPLRLGGLTALVKRKSILNTMQ